jgi:hypothetical protein
MATATKKKRKEEVYPSKAGASIGHTTNLRQTILRLSISMGAFLVIFLEIGSTTRMEESQYTLYSNYPRIIY